MSRCRTSHLSGQIRASTLSLAYALTREAEAYAQNRLTNFNVAISVISLFVLITKMIGVIMHLWFPLIALLFNISLVALYATSVYGQAGPDYADPAKPSPAAWYISKSCSVVANPAIQKSCALAKGTFAATIIML